MHMGYGYSLTEDIRRRIGSKEVETSSFIFVSSDTQRHGIANASYTDPKQVLNGIKIWYLGVDRVRKARLAMLKRELEGLQMKEGEMVDDFMTN